jgi:hypothetical protein
VLNIDQALELANAQKTMIEDEEISVEQLTMLGKMRGIWQSHYRQSD